MSGDTELLILAGSAEARQIAQAVQGVRTRALVSEPPRGPNPLPMPCVLHDFADVEGVMAQMRGAQAVLDASHGFDARMSAVGSAAARALGVPFVSYVRPGWPVDAARNMHRARDVADAVAQSGARVFSATGWASLPEFSAFRGERVFLRQTTRHARAAPFDFVELVFGDPPFSERDETAAFTDLHIDTLICRNLGGQASYPKVAAAIALGIKTVLIDRPPLPEGVQTVDTVAAAVEWVHSL